MKQLILGGARSGKSALAEKLASQAPSLGQEHRVGYIATSDPQFNDGEMGERVAMHRAQRPSEWPTFEVPINLAAGIQTAAAQCDCVLVDCLTLWVTNLLMAGDKVFERERDALMTLLQQRDDLPLIMVSNEVGLGVVPMDKLSRRFVDEAGRLHQALSPLCQRVVFTAAGLPMTMKGPALPDGF